MQYKQLEKYSQRLDAIVESAYDGILTVDRGLNVTYMNTAAREMFEYSAVEVEGLTLNDLIPDNFRKKHDDYVDQFNRSKQRSKPMHTRVNVSGRRKDNSEFPLEVSIAKIEFDGNMEFLAILRDISERSQMLEELQQAATLDHLTGLANKRLFEQEFQHQLSLCRRYQRDLSIVILDLDHFKDVNDAFGHTYGDEVLKRISALLEKHTRESDLASRWGGEEFVLLLPETPIDDAVNLAEKLRVNIARQHFECGDAVFTVSASFGVAGLSHEFDTSDKLFERADALMYSAKGAGRNCVKA